MNDATRIDLLVLPCRKNRIIFIQSKNFDFFMSPSVDMTSNKTFSEEMWKYLPDQSEGKDNYLSPQKTNFKNTHSL